MKLETCPYCEQTFSFGAMIQIGPRLVCENCTEEAEAELELENNGIIPQIDGYGKDK